MTCEKLFHSARSAAFGLVLVAGSAGTVLAEYPEKPVQLFVGFSAGGGTDVIARGFANHVGEVAAMNGMPMVVVNRPGGSGLIAAKLVRDAAPDGYTLTIINSGTFSAADMGSPNAPVNPREDFTSIGCMSQLITSLVVQKSSPYETAASWVEAMKTGGKTVRWATSGAATMNAAIGHLFLDSLGLKHQTVPFKGGSGARNALVAGKVDAAFIPANLVKGFEKDLKTIGVPTAKRDPANKHVPTFAEQGLPALDIAGSMCIWGPKNMPGDVVETLAGAVKSVTEMQDFEAFMGQSGLAAIYLGPDESLAKLNSLYDVLGPVIRNIKG